MTAAEIAPILTGLKDTYLTLAKDAASAVGAAGRSASYKRLKEVRDEILFWEAELARATSGGASRPYVIKFQEPR
ncbi:MAG TPA: hypothetical protein VFH53_00015 [Phycisphaerae bacterium]|nr:hypothetical protein [Phycisphaerae bacterium]